ncbi:uncharacterized protein LOC141910871 isoform X2 [Tubulanus polymorphus]|uniref:uncharacterized protein LOC141910871 isoform X1 n=1 Tax=Tubulanus polymorphus TaxID=672921 RepID=UPI003DA39F7E
MKFLGLILLLVATSHAEEWINKIEPRYTNQAFDARDTASLIEALWSKVEGGVGTVGITGTNVGSETGQKIDAELLKEFVDILVEGAEAALKAGASGGGGPIPGDFQAILGMLNAGKIDASTIAKVVDSHHHKEAEKPKPAGEKEKIDSDDDQMKELMEILNAADGKTKRSAGRRKRGLALKERLAGIIAGAKSFAAKFQKVVDKNVGKSKEILNEIGQQIEDAIDDIVDITPESVKNGVEKIDEVIQEVVNRGKEALAKIQGEMDNDVSEVAGYSLATKTKDFFQPHFKAILDSLTSLGSAVSDLGSDALDKVTKYLATLEDKATVTKDELVALVKDKINDLKDVKDAVKQIITDSISSLDDPAQY